MKPYIFTARNGIHIIDLAQTVNLLEETCKWVTEQVGSGGAILFVGTKRQAQGIIEEEAKRSGQFFVNHRWMGGMLTNFSIMQQRFRRMKDLRELRAAELEDELERLERNFGGMADMKRLPAAVYIVDPKKEHIAVTEARKLHIPVIAIADSNCDPELVDHVIPGNDDAIRAVKLITSRIAEAAIEGRAAARARDEEETAAEIKEELVPAADADLLNGARVTAPEDEVKPEPVLAEEEFAKELQGLDEQDKMMGDA
jgi:small subunit ribosomal protein S2